MLFASFGQLYFFTLYFCTLIGRIDIIYLTIHSPRIHDTFIHPISFIIPTLPIFISKRGLLLHKRTKSNELYIRQNELTLVTALTHT